MSSRGKGRPLPRIEDRALARRPELSLLLLRSGRWATKVRNEESASRKRPAPHSRKEARMEDQSWRKPVERIDDLRSEIMFYRLTLSLMLIVLGSIVALFILREVAR